MALSGLVDASHEPAAVELEALLGASAQMWGEIVSAIAGNHAPVTQSWNFGGAKYGWTLRLKRKERIILYMIPQVGGFLVGLVLGERAVEKARDSRLPESVRVLIDEAPRYAEGRGFRMPVQSAEDVLAVVRLAGIKMAK